jgi:hypothetical protein
VTLISHQIQLDTLAAVLIQPASLEALGRVPQKTRIEDLVVDLCQSSHGSVMRRLSGLSLEAVMTVSLTSVLCERADRL